MINFKTQNKIILIVTLLLYSCDELDSVEYIIENNTDFIVDIRFYDRSSGNIVIPASGSLYQKGGQLFRTHSIYGEVIISETTPILAYQADSVRIIFNEEKYLFYSVKIGSPTVFSESINRNIFKHSNYEYLKGVYVYKLTQQDYETATSNAFDNLLGSVWRCTAGAGLQDGVRYNELRFVSDTTVEGLALTTEDPTPEHLFTATYAIENHVITISDGEDDFFVATLNETQDLVTNIDDEGECVYQRQ